MFLLPLLMLLLLMLPLLLYWIVLRCLLEPLPLSPITAKKKKRQRSQKKGSIWEFQGGGLREVILKARTPFDNGDEQREAESYLDSLGETQPC